MEPRHERESGTTRPGDVAQSAKGAAGEVAGAAKDVAVTRAQSLFDSNKQAAVSKIGAVAHALRNASSELEGQQEPLARVARQAAEKIEHFTQSLESRDLSSALESAQDYARREPALFYGGAFLLGLAAARFLKASSERQHGYGEGERYRSGEYDPTYPVASGIHGSTPTPPI
jgi:hypothetical protein